MHIKGEGEGGGAFLSRRCRLPKAHTEPVRDPNRPGEPKYIKGRCNINLWHSLSSFLFEHISMWPQEKRILLE